MFRKLNLVRALLSGTAIVALGAIVAPVASAHTGEFARFNQCPSTNPETFKCIQSLTTGGEVVLGKKTVPIVNTVTLQGGFTKPPAGSRISKFIAATNGETLSKTPQPVPGGLTGLVNCKEISNILVRIACEGVFENGLTGVNATLELARPASEIEISELNLAFEEGLALKLPVKVHLENPFLGSTCYVGSSATPLTWNLTTGETSPPAGTAPIHGSGGELTLIENAQIAKIANSVLVDNTWPAPGATGCGGAGVELILDPIINASVGVPSPAGKNKAVLKTTSYIARAAAVNER